MLVCILELQKNMGTLSQQPRVRKMGWATFHLPMSTQSGVILMGYHMIKKRRCFNNASYR